MTAAPTSPVTCERDPACSATAVREPLVLTGKPWKKPGGDVGRADADHLLVAVHPLAPAGGERRRRGHRVGQGDHGDGDRAEEQLGQVSTTGTVGTVNGGKPCGSTPIVLTPSSCRSSRLTASAARTTTTSTAGTFGSSRCSSRMPTSEADADRGGRAVDTARRPAPDDERPGLVDQPVGVDGEAEQLGQLADDDRQRQPVHVADLGRLGQQVGDEPEVGEPGDGHDDARPAAPGSTPGRRPWPGRRRPAPAGRSSRRSSGPARSPGRGRGCATGRRRRSRSGRGSRCRAR